MNNKEMKKAIFEKRVLTGMSLDYTIAFIVNVDTDEYEIAFSHETNHAGVVKEITSFREYVDRYAENYVIPEFKESIRHDLNSKVIKERFKTEDDYYVAFETIPNKAGLSCFHGHIIKEYGKDGNYAFLGFFSVDNFIKRERYYKEELENANEALQKQLNMITRALPGGVKISNDDETYSFKYVSDEFANMLGYDSPEDLKEASGGTIVGIAHPDDLETGIADALDQYSRGDRYATTYRMRCKDGSYKYIEDRGQKFIKEDGTVEHWNLILDVNELIEKSIALESEKKANKSKSDFLSRMSHDMRTPLNAIIGLLKINENHFHDRNLLMKNHKKMEISAQQLLNLINNILQMSKIEDGGVALSEEKLNLVDLMKDITAIVGEHAEKAGVDLEFANNKTDEEYPEVYGSPVHLHQIFLNIYTNCIKYNRHNGKIKTVTDFYYDNDERCTYKWTISDTGIGMSENFLKKIFDPFVQEKDDARSNYMGAGLGMSIVKGLIEQMNGTIEITSKEGIGSTFVITVPFKTVTEDDASSHEGNKSENSIKGLHLLLVEDNELNAEIANTMLQDAGAKVTVVGDGLQAVEMFSKKPEGTFDTILMDIMMPVMDGYGSTKAIRALQRSDSKNIPIIALTANAFDEDREKCLQSGMNAHLTKPIDIDKVKKTICENLDKKMA